MSTFEVLSLLALFGVFVWGAVTIVRREEEAREQDFVGEVVDRSHEEVVLTSGVRHDFWLTVRTDAGQVIMCAVKRSVFDSFGVGDRIVKRAGVRWPVKG